MDIITGTATHPCGALLDWAGGTDVGLRRADNQDSFLAAPPFFLVADGMGGHAGGKQASSTLLAGLRGLAGESFGKDALRKVLDKACHDVMNLADVNVDYSISPPGTTLTGLVFLDAQIPAPQVSDPSPAPQPDEPPLMMVLNVGDSRTYQLKTGLMRQLTKDHSQVAQLLEAGALTLEQARTWPNRSVITRAVGAGQVELPDIDTWTYPLNTSRRFLVCSDGLHSMVDEGTIAGILGAGRTPEETVSSLIEAALKAGGADNVTVIVLDITCTNAGDE